LKTNRIEGPSKLLMEVKFSFQLNVNLRLSWKTKMKEQEQVIICLAQLPVPEQPDDQNHQLRVGPEIEIERATRMIHPLNLSITTITGISK
jgi:hypothetical protein